MGSSETSFAERYEAVLVPVIFVPWAREVIRRLAPQKGERILDLACGTGVVTREISAVLGDEPGLLTGADHSADMLDVARKSKVPADWVEADAGALPFADNQFDAAVCQQALQFFPDRLAALQELRRVLKPRGRVVVCVQRELSINPMLACQAAVLDRFAGHEAGDAVRAICGLPDGAVIKGLLEEAGFAEVTVESVSLTLEHPDASAFAEGAMGGMHTGDKLSAMDAAGKDTAVEAFLECMTDYIDGSVLTFPHVSNVVTARA